MASLLKEALEVGFMSNMADFSKCVSIPEERLNALVNGEAYPERDEIQKLNHALSDVEFLLEEEDNDIRTGTKHIIRRIIIGSLRSDLFEA
ncbi:MAG: hypothetical protein IKE91_02960 [Clostridia bacterium]|nr:hypothetical protein [Clostridia bacterium]